MDTVEPPVKAKPLHPLFAAELQGVDLRKPVDAATFAQVKAGMDKYGVCVIRGPVITDEQHIAFSALFGPLQHSPRVGRMVVPARLQHRELFDAGNLDENGRILAEDDIRRAYAKGNLFWHTDSSFNKVRGGYSLLLAHEIPAKGADTEFVDTRNTYDALPQAMRDRIEDLVVEHSVWHSRVLGGYPEPTEEERTLRPPAQHRLVHVHKGSGRKTVYLSAHASHIVGWPVDEGRALLKELTEIATQPRFVYSHGWQIGDLVVWDNTCTMHRATPYADKRARRDMRRTTAREVV
jgi:alpha-ketoglutarate-dependent 2,4-dichlorophenoxyacetate dioxygenase